MPWDETAGTKADQILDWVRAKDVLEAQSELLTPEEATLAWSGVRQHRVGLICEALSTALLAKETEVADQDRAAQGQIAGLQAERAGYKKTIDHTAWLQSYVGMLSSHDVNTPRRPRRTESHEEALQDYTNMPQASIVLGPAGRTTHTPEEYAEFRDEIGRILGLDSGRAGKIARALRQIENLTLEFFDIIDDDDGLRRIVFRGSLDKAPTTKDLFRNDRGIAGGKTRGVLELFRRLGLAQAAQDQSNEGTA